MKSPARAALLIAFASLSTGCAMLPGGRATAIPETEWLSVPEVARPYLERLIRRVDIQWNREIAALESYPPPGSRVVIRYHINPDGLITRIDDVDENAGKAATYACLNAITVPQPYPKWSPEMIESIGGEQEITFAFYFHAKDEIPAVGAATRNPLPP